MELTRLDPADVEVVRPAYLALAAHIEALDTGAGPVRPAPELWERRRAHYVRWLEQDAELHVARDAGELLGYACVRVLPPWGSRETTDPVLDVETLSVMPGARGRGVGRALLDAIRHPRPLDTTLGVPTANVHARRFYARAGFLPFTSLWMARPVPAWATPDGVDVRLVAPDELDRVRPLHRALCERHDHVSPAHLPRRRDPDAVWELERDQHLGEDRFVLRAGDDGYLLAHLRRDGFDIWDTGPVGHVDALAVRDGARGGGVGAALLHAAGRELAARGARAVELEVLEGNDGAHRFYAREGFSRVVEGLYARR